VSIRLFQAALHSLRVVVAGFAVATCTAQAQQTSISSSELAQAQDILSRVHSTLKESYYDPAFHGIDIDARYKDYLEQIKNSQTLPAAHRTIAAYLSGLQDSHTYFMPPPNSNRVTYGYQLQMVGDSCFVAAVRPDTDAARKLHPGDQVISLDEYSVNRKDLWQLEYYLSVIAPRSKSEFVLRDPAGSERHETVATKIEPGQKMTWFSLSFTGGDRDTWHRRLDAEEQQRFAKSRSFEQDGVLFWKLPLFSTNEDDMSQMIDRARKHRSLILDLRGNTGGPEKALTFLLSSLFDHEVRVGKRITRQGEEALVVKSRGQAAYTGPLVVLVDSRSASAAEILGRVVQLEHRGIVLGDRSSGRVRETQSHLLSQGARAVLLYAVFVSSAELIMSDGKTLENIGVTPDNVLLPTASDLAEGRDPVLARAAELAGSRLDATAAGKVFPFQWPPDRLTAF
jgi:C-terminal processing protease CtpA/Prc